MFCSEHKFESWGPVFSSEMDAVGNENGKHHKSNNTALRDSIVNRNEFGLIATTSEHVCWHFIAVLSNIEIYHVCFKGNLI